MKHELRNWRCRHSGRQGFLESTGELGARKNALNLESYGLSNNSPIGFKGVLRCILAEHFRGAN